MDSLRVVIENTEVGYFSAEEMGLVVTWQTKLIDEINRYAVPSTKTIKLPLTKELNIVLNNPLELDGADSISQKEYKSISIYFNESVSVNGWIKLLRLVVEDLNEYIEFTIEPKDKNWVDQFKLFTLTQLDYSDYDHTLNVSNIRSSETPGSGIGAVYAPIDIAEITRRPVLWVDELIAGGSWRHDYYYLGTQSQHISGGGIFQANTYGFDNTVLNKDDTTFEDITDPVWNGRNVFVARTWNSVLQTQVYDQTGFIWFWDQDWQVGDLYPCISIKEILEKCYSRIGYQVSFDFDDLDDKYHFYHNVEQLANFERDRTYFKIRVNVPLAFITFSNITPNPYIMPYFFIEEEGYMDNANFDDTDSDDLTSIQAATNLSRFVASETCLMSFKIEYDFEASDPIALSLIIRQYNSGNTLIREAVVAEFAISGASGMQTARGTTISPLFYFYTGDYIQVELFSAGWTGASQIIMIGEANSIESIPYKGGNFRDKTIRLNEYLSEQLAYDWLKDISLIHNLEFYTNEVLKTVYITTDESKRTGEKIDFRNKINREREIEIEEVGKDFPKTMTFRWKKDDNDWAVGVIEKSLNQLIKKPELQVAFAEGTITNNNVFAIDEKKYEMQIYAPSLDKTIVNSPVRFKTVEMRLEDIWKSYDLPYYAYRTLYKRGNYEPRYLKLVFDENFEDNFLPNATDAEYTIESDTATNTYPRAEFQTPLHFSSLLDTYYAKTIKRINNGWIVRAYLFVNEVDVDGIANILSSDNDFRADYQIRLKGNEVEAELVKIIDYSHSNRADTKIEFLILRDLV